MANHLLQYFVSIVTDLFYILEADQVGRQTLGLVIVYEQEGNVVEQEGFALSDEQFELFVELQDLAVFGWLDKRGEVFLQVRNVDELSPEPILALSIDGQPHRPALLLIQYLVQFEIQEYQVFHGLSVQEVLHLEILDSSLGDGTDVLGHVLLVEGVLVLSSHLEQLHSGGTPQRREETSVLEEETLVVATGQSEVGSLGQIGLGDRVDIRGGESSVEVGQDLPDCLHDGLAGDHTVLQGAEVWCEPGRVVEDREEKERGLGDLGDVVAAFQEEGQVVMHALGLQVGLHLEQDVPKGVLSQVQFAQRVLSQGVEAVGDEHEIRLELGNEWSDDLFVDVDIVMIRDTDGVGVVIDGDVDVEPVSGGLVVGRGVAGVELGLVVLVDADEEHLGGRVEYLLGPVAMVHVPVQNEHSLLPVPVQQVSGCHGHVIEDAETVHCLLHARVVSGRPGQDVGGLCLLLHESVDGEEAERGCSDGRRDAFPTEVAGTYLPDFIPLEFCHLRQHARYVVSPVHPFQHLPAQQLLVLEPLAVYLHVLQSVSTAHGLLVDGVHPSLVLDTAGVVVSGVLGVVEESQAVHVSDQYIYKSKNMLSQLKQTQLLTSQEKAYQHIQLQVPMVPVQEKSQTRVQKHDRKEQHQKVDTAVSRNPKSSLLVNRDIRHVANYVENHGTLQKESGLMQTCSLAVESRQTGFQSASSSLMMGNKSSVSQQYQSTTLKQSMQRIKENKESSKQNHLGMLNTMKTSVNFNVKQIIQSNPEKKGMKSVRVEKHLAQSQMAQEGAPFDALQNFIHHLDSRPEENIQQLSRLMQQDNLQQLEKYLDIEGLKTHFREHDLDKIYTMLRRKVTRDSLAQQQRHSVQDLTHLKNTAQSQLQHSQGIAVFPVFQESVDKLAYQKSYRKICIQESQKEKKTGTPPRPACRQLLQETVGQKSSDPLTQKRILEDYQKTCSKEGKEKEYVAQQNYSALFLAQVERQLE